MDKTIDKFVGFKRIAVVGVSRSNYKYGSIVYRNMQQQGYQMVPVNPNLEIFDGQTCYPNLSALPEPVDGVVIVIPPSRVPAILHEAASLGIRHVWLQPGAESDEALELADELGLELIHTFCVMVEARHADAAHN